MHSSVVQTLDGRKLPSVPHYEGQPVCSHGCLSKMLEARLRSELHERGRALDPYRHRMPLGLLMLARKWITREQLAGALARQRREGYGRLGEWLVQAGAADEDTVARAVAAQWGIPVLKAEEQTREAIELLPRLLVEAFAIVPVRIAAGRILYVAVDSQVDQALMLALAAMTGLRVEPVTMARSAFERLQQRALNLARPRVRIFRSNTLAGLVQTVAAIVEEGPTVNVRLCRFREYFWLQMERAGRAGRMQTSSAGSGPEEHAENGPGSVLNQRLDLDSALTHEIENCILLCPETATASC